MKSDDRSLVGPGASGEQDVEVRLPSFYQEVAARYSSHQNNIFLLIGNVSDQVDGLGVTCPIVQVNSPNRYASLEQYLGGRLESRKRVVVVYNIARGIQFHSTQGGAALREFYPQHSISGLVEDRKEREQRGMRFDRALAESQVYSFLTLKFLEELCKLFRLYSDSAPGNLTIIIKHSETLLPDSPLSQMADIDRQKLTLLKEWFTDTAFVQSDEQIFLIASTSASVHAGIRSLSQVALINLPLPTTTERRDFLLWMQEQHQSKVTFNRPVEELASLAAGMTLHVLQTLYLDAVHGSGVLSEATLLEGLKRLLESELGDKVELMKPLHKLTDVIGATALKQELARLKKLMDARNPSIAPVGILVPGPNGAGKTFIFEAWAAECDRLVIQLKNLRSMWFGQTEQIFEKLRNVLEALGNVIVFIDEADTVFGRPGPNTHETESRLFGSLITMMGNPANRGRIVWILLTARPENLAPDLKRSGRAGLHLPVFDPEGDDRRAYIDWILRRAGFDPQSLTPEQHQEVDNRTTDLSPADFNEVLVELRAERHIKGELSYNDLLEVLQNILPGQIAAQRRLQTLNAYMECSRRTLIPSSLKSLDRQMAEDEIERLRRR